MTTPRSLRIPADLWSDAIHKAQDEGTTVTAVTIAALTTFVAQGVSTDTH